MQNYKLFLIIILGTILTLLMFTTLQGKQWRRFTWIKLDDKRYQVVLATSVKEQGQGLSNRQQLGADGMLFIRPPGSEPNFWMSQMQFDLDFLWLDEQQVVDLDTNIAAPVKAGKIEYVSPTEDSKSQVKYVLEVPAGFIEQEQISVSTRFSIVPIWFLAPW